MDAGSFASVTQVAIAVTTFHRSANCVLVHGSASGERKCPRPLFSFKMSVPAFQHELRRLQLYFGPMWSGKTNRLIQQVDATRQHYGEVVVIKHSVDTRSPRMVKARTGLCLAADIVLSDLRDVNTMDGTLYAVDEAQVRSVELAAAIARRLRTWTPIRHTCGRPNSCWFLFMQFFGDSLLELWQKIRRYPTSSLVASGLDLDFARNKFGSVLDLAQMALLEPEPITIRRLAARCTFAHHSNDHHHLVRHHRRPSEEHAPVGGQCGLPAVFTQRLESGGDGTIVIGGGEYYQPACHHHHKCVPIPRSLWGAPELS